MNDIAIANPFAVAHSTGDTAAAAAAAHAKALVEARYVVALRRPRDMDAVRAKILKDCQRPSFAAVARYVKPIGQDRSKWPTGPSVRFAEAAIRAMGNVTIDATTTHDDHELRIIHVEITDLESNVPYSMDVPIVKTIERRRVKDGDQVLGQRLNSKGDTVYILQATDDDILNKAASLVSKAIRTLALRLVPGDIIDEAMDQIVVTQSTQDAADPDAARRRLFDAFGALGVPIEQLKLYLGNDGAALTPKELGDLRSLYAALRDGEATWREVMDGREGAAGEGAAGQAAAPPTSAKDALASRRASRKTPPPAPAPSTEGAPAKRTLQQYLTAIEVATDGEIAALVLDEARDALSDDELAQLGQAYSAKWQGGGS